MPRESDVRGDRAHKKRIERKQMEAKKRAALRTVLRSDELVNLRTLVSLSMRGWMMTGNASLQGFRRSSGDAG